METTVEIGGWEHECCGPAFERNEIVELRCFVVSEASDHVERFVETHHDVESTREQVTVRGRVVDIWLLGADGSIEPVERVPSGKALRGFNEYDDGHLERPWTSERVIAETDRFLIMITS